MKPKVQKVTLEQILLRASGSLYPDQPTRIVDINAKDCDGDTPLHLAVIWGNRAGVRLLLEAGAQVDAIGDMGHTPLHFAVMYEKVEIAEILLRAGANPQIVSEFEHSPLSLAKEREDKKMLKVFKPT